jgi:hypothetical protein
MKSTRSVVSTRREVVRGLAGLGTVGLVGVAGCLGGSSPDAASAPATDASTATPVATAGPSAGADAAAVGGDCSTVPSSLAPFDAVDAGVEFSFAFDAPNGTGYALEAGETAVERVASFYYGREGSASRMDWDFSVDVTESVDTYGDLSTMFPDAVEAFGLDYAGETVPVRHQAITDDQDVWVMALPQDGAFRSVQVSSSVMPGQFGCHDVVRAVAAGVVRSVRPR